MLDLKTGYLVVALAAPAHTRYTDSVHVPSEAAERRGASAMAGEYSLAAPPVEKTGTQLPGQGRRNRFPSCHKSVIDRCHRAATPTFRTHQNVTTDGYPAGER